MATTRRVLQTCIAVVAALAIGYRAEAAPIQINVDTSALQGTSALLAFDLIDGGPPPNSVAISSFASDGTLGSASSVGGVTGSLAGTLSLADTDFFNEYLQSITLGSFLRFVFDATSNPADPGSLPDTFSFFILDPSTCTPTDPPLCLPLFGTPDPAGADALLRFDIGAADPLAIYSSSRVPVSVGATAAPEPVSYALVIAALLALRLVHERRHRRIPQAPRA